MFVVKKSWRLEPWLIEAQSVYLSLAIQERPWSVEMTLVTYIERTKAVLFVNEGHLVRKLSRFILECRPPFEFNSTN